MSDYGVIIEYGEKKLEPLRVWVEARHKPRPWGLRWLGEKDVWYVRTEFMSQGPFSSEAEAWDNAYELQAALRM